MTYNKPEVVALGDAARVIEFVGKPNGSTQDGEQYNLIPAYDLDE